MFDVHLQPAHMEENTYHSFHDSMSESEQNRTDSEQGVKIHNTHDAHAHSLHETGNKTSEIGSRDMSSADDFLNRDRSRPIIVDTYVRHNQDWIIPRRIMCAFFWVGIILLFTGIVLMVTSKHKEGGAYTSWGAVLLGLGLCLLLICFILCMHAYCVISDETEPQIAAPPLHAVAPPSPTTYTSAHSINPRHRGDTTPATFRSRDDMRQPYMRDVQRCYGSVNSASLSHYSEDSDEGHKHKVHFTLDPVPQISYDSPRNFKKLQFYGVNEGQETDSPRNIKKLQLYSPQEHPLEKDLQIDSGDFNSSIQKQKLSLVGKLPSYSTACQMTQYSPQPESTGFTFADTQQDSLMDAATLTRRARLEKTTTFDDTGSDVIHSYYDATKDSIPNPAQNIAMDIKLSTSTAWSRTDNITQSDRSALSGNGISFLPTPTSSEMPTAAAVDNSNLIPHNEPSHFHHDVTLRHHSNPRETNLKTQLNGGKESPEQYSTSDESSLRQNDTEMASAGSPTRSVYDNVLYMWKPKSGSQLKHFHF